MLTKFICALWGDLSAEEFKKFGMLSVIITIILGNYWMLKVLKNPLFNDLVGLQYQPFAKVTSIFIVAAVVLIYSKLVDLFKYKALFDIICIFYALLFFLVYFAILIPEYFVADFNFVFYPLLDLIPGKLIGWICYFAFESSSLMIILFWSFVSSVTKPESAKKGYAMIVTCTQLGTIMGTAVVTNFATSLGSPVFVGIGGILTLTVPFLVRIYMKIASEEQNTFHKNIVNKNHKTGFFEGLKIIATKPYVIGILIVSTAYEIIATILEFQMNMIAKEVFASRDLYAAFTGKYGMSVNIVTLAFALLGTSFFMRKFGLRFCLVAYPITVGASLVGLLILYFLGTNNIQIMWGLFISMVAIKGFSYALNNPTKEIMYIPTTQDIRFKAKGWIESFGARSAKGAGSIMTAAFARNLSGLLMYGTILSLGIMGIWLLIANLLGIKFNQLQKDNGVIG